MTSAPSPIARKRTRINRRIVLRIAIAGAVAAAITGAAFVFGVIDSSATTLGLMGFDADRAQLISDLLVAAIAAAVITMIIDGTALSTLAGSVAFGSMFGYTFAHQTKHALKSTGADGSFYLMGWALTALTLVVAGVIASWAGATLARAARPGLTAAFAAVRDAVRARGLTGRLLVRPLAVVVVAAILVVSVPVFGDMVNYTTDARMLRGGPPPIGLIPQQAAAGGGANQSGDRAWLAWRPTGSGATTGLNLPTPWTSPSTSEDIVVYTPPGYDPNGTRRYPVLIETPFNFAAWDSSLNIRVALDSLVDAGTIPPMIVVFVNAYKVPAAAADCTDPTDGSPGMDTFLSKTVVSYLDSHYLTIAQANARAITGFSTGGYCAAIVPLRHPDIFGTGIPMSGFFWSDEGESNATQLSPENGPIIAANSPMILATQLKPEQRAGLFFVVVGKPSQPYFGFAATEFEHLLAVEGYPVVSLTSDLPHGWDQVRSMLPGALSAWSTHMVSTGVLH